MNDNNGDVTFCAGTTMIPFGEWTYRVGTAFEECGLSATSLLGDRQGPCIRCGKVFRLGEYAVHQAFFRHLATARMADHFPVDKNGNRTLPALWPVTIQQGERTIFKGPMRLVSVETPLRSLMLTLTLEFRQPIGPAEQPAQEPAETKGVDHDGT